ncbi:hypothetical protein L1887_20166 [Cichorium endivia]|nr:hypothetical protein L1887_20166 [Cichorium endivia]
MSKHHRFVCFAIHHSLPSQTHNKTPFLCPLFFTFSSVKNSEPEKQKQGKFNSIQYKLEIKKTEETPIYINIIGIS